MRIAIVVNDFPAVSETFIINKVKLLAEKGNAIYVYCSKLNEDLWKEHFIQTKNITPIPIGKKTSRQYILTHPIFLLRRFTRNKKDLFQNFVAQAINQSNPDIVHVEFSGLAANLTGAIKKVKAKKIVSCRGSAEKVKLHASEERKQKLTSVFSMVDAIHCVSEDMKQTILPYCNQAGKIFVNHPGIDVELFKKTVPRSNKNLIRILSIGRLTFQKGYLTGLLAINRLKESNPNFKWVIVGDGPEKEEIIFHIHQMQLQQNVMLAGVKSRAEILNLLNQSDIFFLPSVYEGIANAALEAMSMQLPVVATYSGGMGEVITHEMNGFLADAYDSNTLFHHLFHLAHDEELRKKIGEAAREKVVNEFTLEKHVKNFEVQYQNLLKS
ncbi:MAG: glycosyltransferase family 4 protein [Parafilimonas sp.]